VYRPINLEFHGVAQHIGKNSVFLNARGIALN